MKFLFTQTSDIAPVSNKKERKFLKISQNLNRKTPVQRYFTVNFATFLERLFIGQLLKTASDAYVTIIIYTYS